MIVLGWILPRALNAQDAPSRPLRDPGLEIEPTPLPKSSAGPTAAPTPQATPHQVDMSSPKPSPSATPEVSQPPTPRSTPEKSVEKTEETTPEATSTPTPENTPVRSARRKHIEKQTEPTPEPTPLSRRAMHATAAKLKAMEKEWEASFNDPAVIEKTLMDDFVGTSPVGTVTTKRDLMREAREDKSPPPKTVTRDMDVYFCAPDVAIVTGAARQIARNSAGQTMEYNYRFTDTWVERNGEWRCFASQSMLVPPR